MLWFSIQDNQTRFGCFVMSSGVCRTPVLYWWANQFFLVYWIGGFVSKIHSLNSGISVWVSFWFNLFAGSIGFTRSSSLPHCKMVQNERNFSKWSSTVVSPRRFVRSTLVCSSCCEVSQNLLAADSKGAFLFWFHTNGSVMTTKWNSADIGEFTWKEVSALV